MQTELSEKPLYGIDVVGQAINIAEQYRQPEQTFVYCGKIDTLQPKKNLSPAGPFKQSKLAWASRIIYGGGNSGVRLDFRSAASQRPVANGQGPFSTKFSPAGSASGPLHLPPPHCRSEAVEADHLGEMPKVLAAMLFGPLIWRRSSPLAASSICAVWRWSTPTSFNIRSCLALWRVSDVCCPCAFTVGAPFPPDDLFEQAQFSCCSTQQLHFSGP